MSRPFIPISTRFWMKVNKHGPIIRHSIGRCHLWTASTHNGGYGAIGAGGKGGQMLRAPYVAWFLHYGIWPQKDKILRHRCDNPPCVRWSHLVLGTRKQNTQDSIRRKRFVYNIPQKLTTENVSDIKKKLSMGEGVISLAKAFGVHRMTIWRIRTGKR